MPAGTEAGLAATAAVSAAPARSPVAARAAGAVTPPARIIPATTATAASPTAIRMRHLLPRPDEVTRILSVRPPSGCGLRLNFLPSGCVLRLETVSVTPFAWRAPARGVSLHWIPERDTMVGMDSWCPSCGYSVEPGTRFCGGCGQQIAAQDGASAAQSSTVTMQSPPAPFPGYAAPAALPAPAAPLSAPPPPAGSPSPWPPPPTGAPVQPPAPGQQPGAGPSPISDTLEQMLRPQGLFQNRLPPPVDWQQNYPPPGAVPPGGQFPPGAPYQPGGQFPPPPGNQYPATGAFQQTAAPPAWPQAPTGAMPATGAPGQPAGPGQPGFPGGGQWPQGGAYQGPYAGAQFGQEQFPQGQFGPGTQFGPDGMPAGGASGGGLLGKLPFKRPLIPLAVGGGVIVVVVAALLLSSQGGGGTSTNHGGTGTAAGGGATPTASTSTGTTALTQQQAAPSLAGLLAQSGTDHADVNAAVTNVEGCKGLAADAKTFNKAAANRRTLLSKLA